MSTTIKRSDIKDNPLVYYCNRGVYNFFTNWNEWAIQDCDEFNVVNTSDRLIFGVILNGLFIYVEDDYDDQNECFTG